MIEQSGAVPGSQPRRASSGSKHFRRKTARISSVDAGGDGRTGSAMTDTILILNAEPTRLAFAIYTVSCKAPPLCLASGQVDGLGERGVAPHLVACDPQGGTMIERRWLAGPPETVWRDAFQGVLDWVATGLIGSELVAIGHLLAHGGEAFHAPMRLDGDVVAALERLGPIAPPQQRHSLAAIRAVSALRPRLLQIACFDTGFHHGLAPAAVHLGLTRAVAAEGLRRYGCHGLVYEDVTARLRIAAPALAAGRVVMAHLGDSVSLCAVKAGRSLDISAGFSAADGLVMATSCGAIDPGIILYLMRHRGMDAAMIETMLYRRSGLLGVSGLTGDLHVLAQLDSPLAAEAIELFIHRFIREVGALASVLGGLDGIVFTGPLGETETGLRAEIAHRLAWLGLLLDADRNRTGRGRISADVSPIDAWVIPAEPEAMVAMHAAAFLSRSIAAVA
jgi:acetate kinase